MTDRPSARETSASVAHENSRLDSAAAGPKSNSGPREAAVETAPLSIVELAVDGAAYRILLPDHALDYIQKSIAEKNRPYELEMLQDMADRVSADDLVLDVGANIGNHSLYLSAVVGCNVIAYEPNRHLADALAESARLNGLDEQLRVLQLGVGAGPAMAHFAEEIPSNTGAQRLDLGAGEIEIVSLDEQKFDQSVRAIKIDVEGMELDVLQGAAALIERDSPVIYIECATEGEFRRVLRFMRNAKYQYWDTFNATATHLFLPSALAETQDRVQHMKVREALQSYRNDAELKRLRAALNEANEKYRLVSQRINDKDKSLKLATELTEVTKAERDKFELELGSVRAELNEANEKYRLVSQRISDKDKSLKLATEQTEVANVERDKFELELRSVRAELGAARADVGRQKVVIAKLMNSRTYRATEALRKGSNSLRGLLGMPPRLHSLLGEVSALSQLPKDAPATAGSVPTEPLAVPAIKVPLFREDFEPPQSLAPQEGAPAVEDLLLAPRRDLRVAAIMDKFTLACFDAEADLLELTAENWKLEITNFRPNFLFVESAWLGKNGSWDRKVGSRSQELHDMVAWCNENNVPTAFWNKEDPVHYSTFLSTAKLFDCVFTTDIDCIHLYKGALGHDRVWLLPFACQPRIHNPIEVFARKDAINFAGAYYKRYPDRTRDLENFTAGLPTIKPLEIFDRNYGKDDPNYAFPDAFRKFIVGTLPPEHIDIAYKGYRYAINLNSVKQSQSMFARRVYELLASNTVAISNYSRGLRLMFGDLVVSSDDCGEVNRRFGALLESDADAAKLRLAALRKIMSEHTSADRIDYIASKVLPDYAGRRGFPEVTVFCQPTDNAEAHRLLAQFGKQSLPGIRLVMQEPEAFEGLVAENVTVVTALTRSHFDVNSLPEGSWIACWDGRDYYGPNYLYDLVLATRYSGAEIIGKAAHFRDGGLLSEGASAYVPAAQLARRRSIIRADKVAGLGVAELFDGIGNDAWRGIGLAVDPFSYCAEAVDFASVPKIVDDLPNLDVGLPLAEILARAETIEPAAGPSKASGLDTAALANLFKDRKEANLQIRTAAGNVEVISDLPDGKHQYVYSKINLSVSDLLDDGKLRCFFDVTPGLNLLLAVMWFGSSGDRIGTSILHPLKNETVDPPEGAVHARLGLRAFGAGTCEVRSVELAHRDMRPGEVLGRSRQLLVTNHYPSYEDLYRNGFVHSRVRSYRDLGGITPDVFRLRPNQSLTWHEFQGIDCMTGSAQHLDFLLASGRYDHVLVHFLDKATWEVLAQYIDRISVTVWIHGAEVQPWWRRAFNYSTSEDLEKAKAASQARMEFWRSLFAPLPMNLRFVFVSQYFADEVFEDLGVDCPRDRYEIIHNPIDDGLFEFHDKLPDQRGKILSIRPFASAKYANDLSVKAILSLSTREFFKDLEFRIIGDGPLFDEITSPLKGIPNVVCEKRFLSQTEIAALHREYGIFLNPTRMDAQGVSRDEAMSSGLVPVTTRVAAIPEFVDETCGYMADPEDAEGLAEAIADLWNNPETFQRKSRAAAERVRQQSAKAKIVGQELALLKRRVDQTPIDPR